MVNEVDTKLANELIPVSGFEWAASSVIAATLLAAFALFTLVWLIHVKIEDAGIVDFAWGGSFFVTGWLALWLAGGATATTFLLMSLVTVWAARLTAHMAWRHGFMDGEDARYRAMREATGPGFWWKSLFKVYWIQALVQWLVASPLLAAALLRAETAPIALVAVGAVMFLVGFVIESVADRQLWAFKAKPENRGLLMTGGLFAWSRHPNYFGEVVLWWGLGLIAFASSGSLFSFLGPVLLTGLLLKVSGVELLDAHLARTKPGFEDWAARTSAFIPRAPRPAGGPSGDRPQPG